MILFPPATEGFHAEDQSPCILIYAINLTPSPSLFSALMTTNTLVSATEFVYGKYSPTSHKGDNTTLSAGTNSVADFLLE
jgi:hypothetical protein